MVLSTSSFQLDVLGDGFAVDQALDLLLRGLVRLVHKALHHVIAAGVDPVCLRPGVRLCAQQIDVVDHVPRTIYIDIAKAIAVVPFLDLIKLLFKAVIREQLFHFGVRKAKVFIKARVDDRKHLEVVQPRENALLRHTQTAGQDGELQIFVRL